ncbi:Embryo defective 1923 [Theobroma cacao]|uniref:Embryo defective 1923 n=1 Tax=Theobroma cacao TaxID=3641 RepID=A0A061EAM2_THECC|nr:Embryo defective 1923 [Theobroma cacao]
MTIPTIASNFSLKPSLFPLKATSISRLSIPSRHQSLRSFPSRIPAFTPKPALNFLLLSDKRLGFSRNAKSEFYVSARNGGEDGGVDEAERLARGESTMPERFRYLTKEAPDPPVRWPFFVALAFLLYAWRAVLFELSKWRQAAFGIVRFVRYLLKLAVAFIFHFIGDPTTSLIRCIETVIYNIRAFYSGIVAYAPVHELTVIIVLASAVLSIAEATVPNSISCQPYMLTISGLIGYAAVIGYISEPLYWTLLLGIYGFSRLIKKRDDVTSALPVAAVMAAIGEPWVRILVITSYLALAIFHHSKKLSEVEEPIEGVAAERRLPMPLLGAALAIGVHLAAKWAGNRHLTWMIV